MEKKCILITGPAICRDLRLAKALQKFADVIQNASNSRIFFILGKRRVDLILFEISPEHPADIDFIHIIKNQFPEIIILLINGGDDRKLIAKGFQYGAKDAFRKPYHCDLIADRVNVLLSRA
ncbi:response regulator [candidate division KSB1 bacterium]|nr:response regulator [candidate division KSB1 bacterium]